MGQLADAEHFVYVAVKEYENGQRIYSTIHTVVRRYKTQESGPEEPSGLSRDFADRDYK